MGRGSKKKQGAELRLTRVEIRRAKAGWGRSLGRLESEPEGGDQWLARGSLGRGVGVASGGRRVGMDRATDHLSSAGGGVVSVGGAPGGQNLAGTGAWAELRGRDQDAVGRRGRMRAPHSGCGGPSARGGAKAGGAAGSLCGLGHEAAAAGLGPGRLQVWAARRGLSPSPAPVLGRRVSTHHARQAPAFPGP